MSNRPIVVVYCLRVTFFSLEKKQKACSAFFFVSKRAFQQILLVSNALLIPQKALYSLCYSLVNHCFLLIEIQI